MEGLQRSSVSFRRQGSSGLVWDDKFLSELNQMAAKQDAEKAAAAAQQQQENQQVDHQEDDAAAKKTTPARPAGLTIERSRSNGGGKGFRTGRVSPAIEPPSPKVSACGFCGAFGGKKEKGRRRPPPKSGKRKM